MIFDRLERTVVLVGRAIAAAAFVVAGFAVAALVGATPALAHHVMEGKTPTTFAEGLLSGLGHPIIGPDHLAFLIAVGVAVGAGRLNLALPIIFVAAMALGVGARISGIAVPGAEAVVGLSVLLAGFLLARGRPLPAVAWTLLFAIAGLYHGYAFGEAIVGGEPSPLAAYLVGLSAVQAAITIGIALVARRVVTGSSALQPRLIGAAIVGVGLTVIAERLMPGV
jgi:urease accessory protein